MNEGDEDEKKIKKYYKEAASDIKQTFNLKLESKVIH
jgi:hypothetical protein